MSQRENLLRLAESLESVVPVEEQTTLRVPKQIHEKLRVIAAFEHTTIMSITTNVLDDFCTRYESATGRPLTSAAKRKAPKV